jgi:peroxiredoxin
MPIQPGDKIPDVPITIATDDGPKPTTTGEYFKDKKVALFAVPGAFTPTCSARHLPS